MASYSERNGRLRGYSQGDLLSITWGNVQKVVQEQGLLDEMFGYKRSSWSGKEPEEGKSDYVNGKFDDTDSRTWLNRALRVKADFRYSIWDEGFIVDGSSYSSTLPDVIRGDIDMMFDFLEELHKVSSSPNFDARRNRHTSFNKKEGQRALRDAINDDLALYSTPYRMLTNGQIVELDGGALADLAEQGLELNRESGRRPEAIDTIHHSINMFMKRGNTLAEKKAAVTELAGALESLRPQIKRNLLTDDEKELFAIANNFAVRHQNTKQKSNYDQAIWYDWMFQVNLAALLTVIRIIQAQE